MRVRTLSFAVLLVLCLIVVACGKPKAESTASPAGTGTSAPAGATATPGATTAARATPTATPLPETDLAAAELPDFASLLERAVKAATVAVVKQVAPDTSPSGGDGAPREFSITVGARGSAVNAEGLVFEWPWPARYESAFSLDGFIAEPGLTVRGALQVNFVYDDRADPPVAYTLFRGVIEELGRFKGRYSVHGEVQADKLTALVTGLGRGLASRNFGGRAPRDFLSYVSTIAGTGKAGNKDGEAMQAQFDEPRGVFVDHKGRIWVADTGNHAVREISRDGKVSTLATAFEQPADLGMDGIGLLVVSDRVQSVPDGRGSISQVVTDGVLKGTVIRLVGASGTPPGSPYGYCFITSDPCDGRTPMARMTWVGGIDVQGGLILAAQWAWSWVRAITPDGMVMTLVKNKGECEDGGFGSVYDVAQGNGGEVYFTGGCHVVNVIEPDGTRRVLAGTPTQFLGFKDGRGAEARFSYPEGLVFDGEKYLYVAESSNATVRRVDVETGDVVLVAGCRGATGGTCSRIDDLRNGPGDYALFYGPTNLSLDKWGDIYVADKNNHAIRLVRMVNDPDRTPAVTRIQPLALQKGAKTSVTVTGRSLGLTRSVDLGPGIKAEIIERGYKRLKLAVEVAEDAEAGARTLSVTTPFGKASTPDGMSLTVMTEKASKAQVRTIAGTGKWSPGINDLVPAEKAEFAFPAGMAAIDSERLLVADPLEQRIRLITTKEGAARELLELAVYEGAGATGLAILQGIEGFEKIAGDLLGLFGADNFTSAPREEILKAITAALDEICKAANSDCEYMALPWAGLPMAPGYTNGFRLSARLTLPVDVAVVGDGQFLIADSGNSTIRTVGMDISGDKPKDAPYQVVHTGGLNNYPMAVDDTGSDTAVASTSADSTLAKLTLVEGGKSLTDFAGVRYSFRCERKDEDVRHPVGLPMGISTGKSGTFVADPYCKTIWRLEANGEVEDIRGKLKIDTSALPKCSDGPLVFATWGAPMDLAQDAAGNIWVADAGCHSVRVIKDLLGSSDAAAIAGKIGGWAGTINSLLKSETVASVSQMLQDPDLGDLDAARWWVVTVAGGPDGEPGFKDGPAGEARFNAPVGIAVAQDDDKTFVFVSDVGNKRIRLMTLTGDIAVPLPGAPTARPAAATPTVAAGTRAPAAPTRVAGPTPTVARTGTPTRVATATPTPLRAATATPTRTTLGTPVGRATATPTPGRTLPTSIAIRTPVPNTPLAPLAAANKLMSLPWEGISAQLEADAVSSIKESLEDKYLLRGTGESFNSTLRTGSEWEFSLRVDDVRVAANLSSPPGFTSVSDTAFGFGAPRTGAWSFSVAAGLAGRAIVDTTRVRVFTWNPPSLNYELGVRDLRVSADARLKNVTALTRELDSASVTLQATVYGRGAIDFTAPISVTLVARDGVLIYEREIADAKVDLGGVVDARIQARLKLTVLPLMDSLDFEVGPLPTLPDSLMTFVDLPEGLHIKLPTGKLIDLSIAYQIIDVEISGSISVSMEDVGRVSAPFSHKFNAFVPSSAEFNRALVGLQPPIPRQWGEDPPPAKLKIDTTQARSDSQFATVATEVKQALRDGHMPNGLVHTLQQGRFVPVILGGTPGPSRSQPDTWQNGADSALWTGHYLAAEAYRSAATGDPDALTGADLALSGLERVFWVTEDAAVTKDGRVPVRWKGLLSRTAISYPVVPDASLLDFSGGPLTDRACYYMRPEGGWQVQTGRDVGQTYSTYALGRLALAALAPAVVGAPTPTAGPITGPIGRQDSPTLVPQGKVWYGYGCSDDRPVSKDQYTGVMMGLAMAHMLIEDPGIKARTARLIELTLDYLIENKWTVRLPPDDRIETEFFGDITKQLGFLRIGKTVNPAKYGAMYDEVARASELTWLPLWLSGSEFTEQYYKFNLVQTVLVPSLLLEDSPAIRAGYAKAMDVLWGLTGHHRNVYFALLQILGKPASQRPATLAADSRFDPDVTLSQEIKAVLGEWVSYRDLVKGDGDLPLGAVPNSRFLYDLWPNEIGEYTTLLGADSYLAVNALPVWARVGQSKEFMWQRYPFETGMKHDRSGLGARPQEDEIIERGAKKDFAQREYPGVDYLIAYWLARYLDVLE